MTNEFEKHLIVYKNRSEYVSGPDKKEVFKEGAISEATKKSTKAIKDKFEDGFLEKIITEIKDNKSTLQIDLIDERTKSCLEELVESVTSEVGRALIGLTVMQLCIKAMDPTQSIRLHKGGTTTTAFSWQGGISMRTLDKNYVTPALRKYDLLKLNADGFMMTRSLAENYPYSLLYKAQLKGARDQWLEIVELLEAGTTEPLNSLKFFIGLLLNKAENFIKTSDEMLAQVANYLAKEHTIERTVDLIKSHIHGSGYAARLMEISMHALMQAASEFGAFGLSELKPLSQMRSANKKHGNIGDIELLEDQEIVESWDAKYGKAYLRDEIDEVVEKIADHQSVAILGFVTTVQQINAEEAEKKIKDYQAALGVNIQILAFDDWIQYIFDRVTKENLASEDDLARSWLVAYSESLAQKRRTIAPIDEPCIEWVQELKAKF